jgi:hypothetical protein
MAKIKCLHKFFLINPSDRSSESLMIHRNLLVSWHRESSQRKAPVEKSELFDREWVEWPTLEGHWLFYDGEVRYNDFCFARILEKLNERNLS